MGVFTRECTIRLSIIAALMAASGCSRCETTGVASTGQPISAGETFATMEEAAIAAWEFHGDEPSEDWPVGGRSGTFDRDATLALMRSTEYALRKSAVDLNGDGVDEVLIANGLSVGLQGERVHYDGMQNGTWAVLQRVGDRWRVIGAGFGSPCPPSVCPQSTRGWRDLRSGWHVSASHGMESRYQFDGAKYFCAWEREYGSGVVPQSE